MKHATDPVCEKEVLIWWSTVRGLQSEVGEKPFYFCSAQCKSSFDLRPSEYALHEDQMRADDDGMAQPTQGPVV